jgi:hypothetical protein
MYKEPVRAKLTAVTYGTAPVLNTKCRLLRSYKRLKNLAWKLYTLSQYATTANSQAVLLTGHLTWLSVEDTCFPWEYDVRSWILATPHEPLPLSEDRLQLYKNHDIPQMNDEIWLSLDNKKVPQRSNWGREICFITATLDLTQSSLTVILPWALASYSVTSDNSSVRLSNNNSNVLPQEL